MGGYLYGGYSRISNNARLWVVNPGIEVLGSRWDAHLNAYFPMGDRHINAGNGMSTFFSGHSQLGSIFLIDQYAGSGADVKVAYQPFQNSSLKGYLGSYYFSPAQTNNIWGGAAGVEYWLTQNVKMIGSYTYDKLRHSTYAFGVGLEWGGTRVNRVSPDLEERLTDPVERYLAELGHGSKIPSRIKDQSTGGIVVLANNIAFFSQTGSPNNDGIGLTLANCTFENPCGPTDFTQTSVTTLGGLLPNTQFYFNGGTYTTTNTVTLDPGQSLQSRTTDYSQPASGSARSAIASDTITLQGNNSIENMVLLLNDINQSVDISGANNTIVGSQIGNPSTTPATAVKDTGTNTSISNSEIFANISAIQANGSTTTVQNTQMTVTENPVTGERSIGISAENGANVTVNNSQVQVNASLVSPYGLQSASGSQITATNTDVTTIGNGLNAYSLNNNTNNITISGGNLDTSGAGGSAILAPGSNAVSIGNGTVCQVNGTTIVCP